MPTASISHTLSQRKGLEMDPRLRGGDTLLFGSFTFRLTHYPLLWPLILSDKQKEPHRALPVFRVPLS